MKNSGGKMWDCYTRMLNMNLPTYCVALLMPSAIECFHSRGQHICKFIGTKESVCMRKEFNSQRTGLGHQHGRRFIVLEHQYGRRDVMWKHSIDLVTVFDAILTNRQKCEKLQCLYENLMSNNFRTTAVRAEKNISCKLKLQSKRLS